MQIGLEFEMQLKALIRPGDMWNIPVLGIMGFHVCPVENGLGRLTLELIKGLAKMHKCSCAAAFVEEKEIEFYRTCGWLVDEEPENGKYFVRSEDVKFHRPLNATW